MGWSPDDKHRKYVQRCAHCGVPIHPEEIYCGVCASEDHPETDDDFKRGVQPDPVAAKLVSHVALLLEQYGDHFFDG